MTFADVIAPVRLSDFIDCIMGHRFMLLTQHLQRFSRLVDWSAINDTLMHARFSETQLRLAHSGKMIKREEYMGRRGTCVDARRLERLIAAGATLILNDVDELFPEVQVLAESCEEHFRFGVNVNLYAGWHTDNGFDLHWDRHDTVILQVLGRKRWKVYEPTLPHPLDGSLSDAPTTPTGQAMWEGVLANGDVLYMPRGWWHVAFPLGEPTLHLTVGLRHPTGEDLLRWLAMRLNRRVEHRSNVPYLQSADRRRAYLAEVRAMVAGALTEDCLEHFVRAMEGRIQTRPRTRLSNGRVTTRPLACTEDANLRLTVGPRLYFERSSNGSTVQFKIGESDWSCDVGLLPALRLLSHTRPTTLREMTSTVEDSHLIHLRALVTAMVARDALWAERSSNK
jgi:hypothetical protein